MNLKKWIHFIPNITALECQSVELKSKPILSFMFTGSIVFLSEVHRRNIDLPILQRIWAKTNIHFTKMLTVSKFVYAAFVLHFFNSGWHKLDHSVEKCIFLYFLTLKFICIVWSDYDCVILTLFKYAPTYYNFVTDALREYEQRKDIL